MEKELEQKMINYIDALEKANEQLVIALKKCLELLARVQPTKADQEKWKNMLEEFENIVKVGESIADKKLTH